MAKTPKLEKPDGFDPVVIAAAEDRGWNGALESIEAALRKHIETYATGQNTRHVVRALKTILTEARKE